MTRDRGPRERSDDRALTALFALLPALVPIVSGPADSGAGLYACKASVDMFKLTDQDFVDQVDGVMTVGEFYGLAGGGEIIFT